MVTILIVEDDEMMRKLMRCSLEKHDYQVIEAANGEVALECFNSKIIDLAILDVNIGKGINGFEVCRNIRKDLYGGLIPIVFMTSEKSEQSLMQGFQEGADAYIHKPCSMPELVARVKALLKRSSFELALQALGKQDLKRGSIIEGKQDSYRLKNLMEKGGMGAVFLAQRQSNDSLVAIKTIMPTQLRDQSDLKRFLREAKITIEMEHENIANGIELIRSDGYFALVLEYIEGHTLKEVVNIKNNLTNYQATNAIEQIAQALNHLEQAGIVHRDIQPNNIIISKDGRAILIDMGISKAREEGTSITRKDIILGTIAYMAPESVVNKTDITGDIYSLGLTFFYALTGSTVYGSEDIDAILIEKLSEEVAPKFLGHNIPTFICNILEKMTFKNPHHRYQKFAEVIQDLQKAKVELQSMRSYSFE